MDHWYLANRKLKDKATKFIEKKNRWRNCKSTFFFQEKDKYGKWLLYKVYIYLEEFYGFLSLYECI